MFPYEVLSCDRFIELFASTLWIQCHFTSCVFVLIMWSLCFRTIWSGFCPPCCAINVRMFLYCTNMPTWFKLDIAAHRFFKAAEFREQHIWICWSNWAEVSEQVCDTGSFYVGAGSDPEQRACFNHRRSTEQRNWWRRWNLRVTEDKMIPLRLSSVWWRDEVRRFWWWLGAVQVWFKMSLLAPSSPQNQKANDGQTETAASVLWSNKRFRTTAVGQTGFFGPLGFRNSGPYQLRYLCFTCTHFPLCYDAWCVFSQLLL